MGENLNQPRASRCLLKPTSARDIIPAAAADTQVSRMSAFERPGVIDTASTGQPVARRVVVSGPLGRPTHHERPPPTSESAIPRLPGRQIVRYNTLAVFYLAAVTGDSS